MVVMSGLVKNLIEWLDRKMWELNVGARQLERETWWCQVLVVDRETGEVVSDGWGGIVKWSSGRTEYTGKMRLMRSLNQVSRRWMIWVNGVEVKKIGRSWTW